MTLQQKKHLIFRVLFSTLRCLNWVLKKFRTKRSNSLLIVQLHFIGDAILLTPAISLLKKEMPHLKLHILVSKNARPIVAHNPAIDKIYSDHTDHTTINSPSLFIGKVFANLGNILTMWKENYDYVIDYSGYFDSAFVANVVGGKNIIGMSVNPALTNAYDYFHYLDYKDRKLLGSNYLDLLSYFKISYTKDDGNYRIFLSETDTAAADKIMHNAHGVKIAIAPFAGWASKEWPLGRFVTLCNKLAEMPATLSLLGDAKNGKMLESCSGQLNAAAICCAGKTSLMESAAIIAKSDLFIGVDSAMSYVAAAFGIPSVLIFGSTNPAFHWEENPGKLTILYKEQACSCTAEQLCCGDNTIIYKCPYNNRCMHAVSVEEVYSSAQELLAKKGGTWGSNV